MANQWLRLYSEFATDPKIQTMSEQEQRRFIMLLCLQCGNGNETFQDDYAAFQMRISMEDWRQTKSVFIQKKLIKEDNTLLNWNKRQFISDTSTYRVKRHREAKKEEMERDCNVSVTTPDTDTDTDTYNKKINKKNEIVVDQDQVLGKSSLVIFGNVTNPKPRAPKKNDLRHEEFYLLYPRKKSKHDSQKAFDSQKFTEKEFALVMSALRMQISEWKKDGKEAQFLPYPASWIRAGSWNDCPDPATFASGLQDNLSKFTPEALAAKEKAKKDDILESERKRKDFESLLHSSYPEIFGDDLYHPLLFKKAEARYWEDKRSGLI